MERKLNDALKRLRLSFLPPLTPLFSIRLSRPVPRYTLAWLAGNDIKDAQGVGPFERGSAQLTFLGKRPRWMDAIKPTVSCSVCY
jgi:hypothetical protein